MSRHSAELFPSALAKIFANDDIPSVTSQESTFFDKIRHWSVTSSTGLQASFTIHIFCNVLKSIPTVSAVMDVDANA